MNMESYPWKVLLVEDDEDDFVLVRDSLHLAGPGQYDVHWVENYQSALQAIQELDPDAVLVDYFLEAGNGLEFIGQAVRLGCKAPLIMITGLGNYQMDLEAMQAGAADFLRKSELSPSMLERAIRYAIRNKHTEDALRTIQDELEQRVLQRTRELRLANEELSTTNTVLQAEIAERIRAESKLAFQAYLLEHVNDAVVATDRELRLTAWNPAAEAIYGWKAGEVLGQSSTELLKTDFQGIDRSRVLQILHETGQFNGEVIQYRRDGQPILIELKTTVLLDEQRRISGYVSVNRDITNRKQAEQQLQQNSQRNAILAELSQLLAEAGPVMDKVLDLITERVAERIGDACVITLLEPGGQSLRPVAYHHPDPEGKAFLQALLSNVPVPLGEGIAGRVAQSGQPVLIPSIPEEQMRAAILPELWPYLDRFGLSSLLVLPLSIQGQVIGTLGITRDKPDRPYTPEDQTFLQELANRASLAIANARLFNKVQKELAEREKAEQALRKSETRFRTIFEESPVGIELKDLDGRVLDSNPALQEMLGYDDEELRQMTFADFTHPEDIPGEEELFKKLAAGDIDQFRMEKRLIHKDGRLLWVRLATSLVSDESGQAQFIIAIIENITERKHIESELAEVQRRLMDGLEAERLHLAQELHDGPMQDLYGISYAIKSLEGELSSREATDRLDAAQAAIQQVNQTLRLMCTELRPPTLAPFGLEKTIRSHAAKFYEEHPEIKLHLELAHDAQLLPEQFRLALFRIYQHALANVVRHSGASEVFIRFKFDEFQVQLEIEDNGRGFEIPTRWVEMARQGHLGLVGATERAEAIGGTLKVFSKPGKGTRVLVSVPLLAQIFA